MDLFLLTLSIVWQICLGIKFLMLNWIWTLVSSKLFLFSYHHALHSFRFWVRSSVYPFPGAISPHYYGMFGVTLSKAFCWVGARPGLVRFLSHKSHTTYPFLVSVLMLGTRWGCSSSQLVLPPTTFWAMLILHDQAVIGIRAIGQ